MDRVKIIECPRDAMQGIKSHFIPTELKAQYINMLLKVGFDTIDFGSFVSPKAIPQMRDTAAVLKQLDITSTQSKLLAIVANVRGAKTDKEVVAYLSMGFGNPYGDPWSVDIVGEWTHKLVDMGIKILSLSDTVGVASAKSISYLFSHLIPLYPHIEFGAHLHTTPTTWFEKIDAAYKAGCKRFDGAIKGFGGCPILIHYR